MRYGSLQRMGLSALVALAGISVWGFASTAEAQLLPNAPINRQRPPCDQELPVYQKYRAAYYGYHPTCWRAFPDGWGCPSPARANIQEEYRKLPLTPPEPDDFDNLDDPGLDLPKDDEPGLDMPNSDNFDDLGMPPLPDETNPGAEKNDNFNLDLDSDPSMRPAPGDNFGAEPRREANPGASLPGDSETSLPPLPRQIRDDPRGILEVLPPHRGELSQNAMDEESQGYRLPALPAGYRSDELPSAPDEATRFHQVPQYAPATSMRGATESSTNRDQSLKAVRMPTEGYQNFDYHAGQSQFIPKTPPQTREARRPGLFQNLFRRSR